jgi:hypothetical protein
MFGKERLVTAHICVKCCGSGSGGTSTADGFICHGCLGKGIILVVEPTRSVWLRNYSGAVDICFLLILIVAGCLSYFFKIIPEATTNTVGGILFISFLVFQAIAPKFIWKENAVAADLIDFYHTRNAISDDQKKQLEELAKQSPREIARLLGSKLF